MNILSRLEEMRGGDWNIRREEVLRICWVELHNYDSTKEGIFSDKLDKISGLLSHCSLERFSSEITKMSTSVKPSNSQVKSIQ